MPLTYLRQSHGRSLTVDDLYIRIYAITDWFTADKAGHVPTAFGCYRHCHVVLQTITSSRAWRRTHLNQRNTFLSKNGVNFYTHTHTLV